MGERTGVIYRIGQQVRIKVVKADPETREIDFELISAEPVTDKIELPKNNRDSRNQKKHNRDQKEGKSYRNNKKNKSQEKGNQPFYKKVNKKKKGKNNRNKKR